MATVNNHGQVIMAMVQEKKNKKSTKLRFVKMKVIEDQTSESFEKVLQQM